MIRLTGHIDVPPDRLAAVSAALPEHIRLTRAEPGCVKFDVNPDPETSGRFLVSELFASSADFDAHQTRVRGADWGRITDTIARDYVVETLAP